jgi:hypothetical protein
VIGEGRWERESGVRSQEIGSSSAVGKSGRSGKAEVGKSEKGGKGDKRK